MKKPDYGERDDRTQIECDIVFVWMGQSESLHGPERIDEFMAAYKQHLDQIAKYTKRIVLVTPTPFRNPLQLELDIDKRNTTLARYADEIRKLGRQQKLPVVDLFAAIQSSDGAAEVSRNGLHLNSVGHWLAARTFASQLGFAKHVNSIKRKKDPVAKVSGTLVPESAEILRAAIGHKNDLWFRYWRPTNWAFLYGNRQQTASSRDHMNPSRRWFPKELQNALPYLEEAELRIQEAVAGTVREMNK
ncbi:MAG: hypothetical protein GY875_04290 [Gammaproteobacteria bacterium]|nr:hypothetical protein [Gammaproteobacteria bacterium]